MVARILGAFSLTAVVAFVTQWTDLLLVPFLVHPDWQSKANATARPFSVAAFLLIMLFFYRMRPEGLRKLAIGLVCLWIALMIGCLLFYGLLGTIGDGNTIERTIFAWFLIYEAAAVTAVAAATAVALWLLPAS